METTISWLKNNGYEDIAELIEEIMKEWKEQGNKTRHNWWEKLCGDKSGNSKSVAGRKIPVLRAAQIRQGKSVTKNAICRNENELPPKIRENTRWNNIKSP